MDCALWLNKRKIFSAEEIPANFDIAAIRGYFLGGSLIPWLKANGGASYAEALERIDPSTPKLNDTLSEIFGKHCNAPVHRADEQLINFIDNIKGGCAPAQNIGSVSVRTGSYNADLGSYRLATGSYVLSSYLFGSYRFGSYKGFSLWEWEWEWYLSSFRKKSGSFAGITGSYNLGSYKFGGFGSFNINNLVFGSLRLGMDTLGSYRGVPMGSMVWISADEYDKIMYQTLGICPLDRFGYGIHII